MVQLRADKRFAFYLFNLFIFCILSGNGRLFAQQVSVESYDAKVANGQTVHNLTNVPAGALLVVTTTCQYGASMNASISASGLTWTKQVDAESTGGAEIHTAVFTAGGSISVTSNWGPFYQSSVCYVVVNQEANLGGVFVTGTSQSFPSVNITTTRDNSLLFCATSDWNAGTGTITYNGNATQTFTDNDPTKAAFYHYYYSPGTAGPYTIGMTSPDMTNGASTSVLEIRTTGDGVPPSVVTLGTSVIGGNSIDLSWTAATDNVGVTGYDVYVGGVLNGTTTATTYSVSGLVPFTQYSIYVRAKDAAGNGTNSNTITPTTIGTVWSITGNTGTTPSTHFIGTTDAKALSIKTNNVQRILVSADGNVGIGTTAINGGTYKLYVQSGIRTEKIKVDQGTNWPDYVFDKHYKIPTLKEVEAFIAKNQHLPGVPSAKQVQEQGLDLGDNQAVLLKKIEELTLYIIEMNKKIENLSRENEELKSRMDKK